MFRTSAFLVDRTLSSEFAAMVSASSIAASSAVPVSMSRSASPIRQRLGRSHGASGERQLRRPAGADQPDQVPRRAELADGQPNPHEARAETGRLVGDSDVGGQGQRQASARCGTADSGDHRIGQRTQRGGHGCGGLDSSVNSGTDIRVSTSTSSRSKPVQNALPPAPVMINARSGALRNVAAAQASSPNISTVCEFAAVGAGSPTSPRCREHVRRRPACAPCAVRRGRRQAGGATPDSRRGNRAHPHRPKSSVRAWL